MNTTDNTEDDMPWDPVEKQPESVPDIKSSKQLHSLRGYPSPDEIPDQIAPIDTWESFL
jgi:hypothetical protein